MSSIQIVPISDFFIGPGQALTFFSGPCVIESEDASLYAASTLKEIFSNLPFNFVFKSSFDKANRSALNSYRGPGLQEGLRILEKVKREFDVPIVTDIHLPEQAAVAAEVCDVLQIPAFLCRQTDLLVAAAKSGAVVKVKKGQFMAPHDMGNVINKLLESGCKHIILTDRGTSFGYHNLVSDMRAIPIMQNFGFPVCFDATHSVQLPGGLGTASGGQREFIPTLAKSAIAAGANCLFMEAHPDPDNAKSDAASQIPFASLPELLLRLGRLYEAVQS